MSLRNTLKSVVPPAAINGYHLTTAVAAATLAGFPARGLQVFGVTGTNGKTTTCFFLQAILVAARCQTGLATTVQFSDGITSWRNEKKMTTLPASTLQQLLGQVRRAGSKAAVVEVTSHALVQHRAWGIGFDTVIFTNLTHDHLDYHLTPEAYRAAKERLFALPHRVSVVNADDRHAASFLAYPASRILRFSLIVDADVTARSIKLAKEGIEFTLVIGDEQRRVRLQLTGRFNVANALAAAAAAHGSNIGIDTIIQGLESVSQVPGRMELIQVAQPFRVLLDYAHTPDALKQVFETVRATTTKRIIHVGGATGNRDKTKRPLLGALAAQYADIIIVTNEDPDNEEPAAIIEAVVAGVRRGAGSRKQLVLNENLFVILDRAEAIRTALRLAEPGDTVLVTGKGDESAMVVNGQLLPYSDRATILAVLGKVVPRPQ
ncbi:MAG: UDP-N-acetylmuramoyl-L-alanyl-D-glutamate--2,6-diaminopimelate ligase [Patescibacteria group bacterium]